jgi:hypothetical protein
MVHSRGSRNNAGVHFDREAGSEATTHVAVCGYMTFSLSGLKAYTQRYPVHKVPIQSVQLNAQTEEKFIWKWTANQRYSASSAYCAFFLGQCGVPGAR